MTRLVGSCVVPPVRWSMRTAISGRAVITVAAAVVVVDLIRSRGGAS